MGAVALSRNDEVILEELRKTLDLPSKAQVIHRALEELLRIVERRRLAQDIRASVEKCGEKDLKEHQELSLAAFHLSESE